VLITGTAIAMELQMSQHLVSNNQDNASHLKKATIRAFAKCILAVV